MTDLERIEGKLDLILHILSNGKKSYDMEQEARKVIEMKMRKKEAK